MSADEGEDRVEILDDDGEMITARASTGEVANLGPDGGAPHAPIETDADVLLHDRGPVNPLQPVLDKRITALDQPSHRMTGDEVERHHQRKAQGGVDVSSEEVFGLGAVDPAEHLSADEYPLGDEALVEVGAEEKY